MPSRQQFPDGTPADLRPYLPALRHLDRLAREELADLRRKAEAREFAPLRRSRQELRELKEIIRTGCRP